MPGYPTQFGFKRLNKMVGIIFVTTLLLASVAHARVDLFSNIETLDQAAIQKLSDQELINKYIDIMIELEASQTFHRTSGFSSPAEYNKFKDLLRYRTYLFLEIEKRKLEIPKIAP